MVSPIEALIAKDVAAVPMRITGFMSTGIGKNGSGARASHQKKAADSMIDRAMSPKIKGEFQGNLVPPQVSANNSAIAAAIIRAAPTRSSWWGRSCRGRRFKV